MVGITTHGMARTRIYRIWAGMKSRCNNPKDDDYKNYGGRGITVCEDWDNSFEPFHTWAISAGYRDDLTIDRIDNNKGYCPENCRWATRKEQNRNFRPNHLVTINGETKCLASWADELGINYETFRQRVSRNLPDEKLIEPQHERHMITYNGETKCIGHWAKQFGISRATIRNRIKAGLKLDEVFRETDRRFISNGRKSTERI